LNISGRLELEDFDNLGLPMIKVLEEGSTHLNRIILRTEVDKNGFISFLRELKTPKIATFEVQMKVVRG
jgi:hypothetical protein